MIVMYMVMLGKFRDKLNEYICLAIKYVGAL